MRNDTWSVVNQLIAFPVTLGWGLAHRQNKHKVPVKVLVLLCSPTPKDIFSHSSQCIQWRFWEGETNCVCATQTQSNTMLIWHWKMKNCQNIFSRRSALVTLGNPKSSLNSLHLPFISTKSIPNQACCEGGQWIIQCRQYISCTTHGGNKGISVVLRFFM